MGSQAIFALATGGASAEGEETVYRVFGDEALPLGKSWTPVNPNSVLNYRNVAGLPVENSGRFIIEGTIKKSDIILKKFADPIGSNIGGIPEYIIDGTKVNIIRVSGVNPPF